MFYSIDYNELMDYNVVFLIEKLYWRRRVAYRG